MEKNKELLLDELNTLPGVVLDEYRADQLLKYYEMLIQKNKVMNLTRIVDFEDALHKHFADSLSIARCIDMEAYNASGTCTLLDLGSGGGFPGIPVKIVWPGISVVMIDSVGKKVKFLTEVISELQLEQAYALHGRAEDFGREVKYREKFDICTSRAVADLSVLSEYCLPFVKTGGSFIAYKSGDSRPEIEGASRAISALGGGPAELSEFELYGMRRILVKCNKKKHTPGTYPRKAGMPSKAPIH